jgi:hypothetical protein
MNHYTFILIGAGVLAGLVNFFANYVNLPFAKPPALQDEEPPELKSIIWVALIGYCVVGCAGAFLTYVIQAITEGGLKGLEWKAGALKPEAASYDLILFGYGLVFGYSTTRLLISLLEKLTKKIANLELNMKQLKTGLAKAGIQEPAVQAEQETNSITQ